MDKSKTSKNKHWLSLEQWRNAPEFKELVDKEFQTSPLDEESQSGWARRDFLKLMGASLALGSFGCIRRPIQKIVPYVKRPEEIIPGVSNYYASSLAEGGNVLPLVVRTREGRPIKLEGNEFFPEVGEALSARGQAYVLDVYDPDRLNGPKQNLLNPKRTNRDTISTNWKKVDAELKAEFAKGGVYVFSGENPSQASKKLIGRFAKEFKGEYLMWSPDSYGKFKKSFSALGGESKFLPRYRISKANYILSVGTDFLETEYGALQNSREWGEARDVEKREPVKLVQVESMMTVTGSNADQRIILKPSEYLSFLCAVISYLETPSNYAKKASRYEGIKKLSEGVRAKAKTVAEELKKNKGRSIVMGFGTQTQGADYEEILKATHFLNSVLENDGATIDYSQAPYASYNAEDDALEKLIKAALAGQVKTLIIHNSNPVYTYGDSARLKKALQKVKTVIYTGDKNDETGRVSHYLLPDDHKLEKWNEFETFKDIFVVSQPTISPLYDTRAFEQSLLVWLDEKDSWYDVVKAEWKERFNQNKLQSGFSDFNKFWIELLQKGVWDLSKFRNSTKPARSFVGDFKAQYKEESGLELVVYPTVAFASGLLSNVSWLQEFPDPISKIVWDNFVSVSLAYAEMQGLKEGDLIEISSKDAKLELPVHIQPGQEDNTLAVSLGYGREGAGRVCEGIGQNAYPLTFRGGYAVSGAKAKKTGKSSKLANVQGHHTLEGRNLAIEASYNEYQELESAGIHKHKIFSLWSKHKYTGHKWAMSVDLSKCTGCSACVVACQAENNIPVVGKKHVLSGREMHWIRVDRYYAGSPKNPRVIHQPVMCMHCDNAPCETVCPVLATVHSSEGTNDMVYNRCVGTRYCSNNCPYKVRRFNWFNYSKIKSPLNMALNPEVTVRSRGVMEKCTFCIHKIRDAKSKASLDKRELRDGEIKPACEQTCATKALVFGDMNDKESAVSKNFEKQRTYQMLEELNVVPSVRYMTKIWNTEKHLVDHHGGQSEEKGQEKKSSYKEEHQEGEAH